MKSDQKGFKTSYDVLSNVFTFLSSIIKIPATNVPTSSQAYVLLNYPKSSQLATVLSLIDCVLIFLAVTLLILETEPQFKDHFENPSNPYYKYLFWLNTTIIVYFTLDYLLRLFTHASFKQFFKMFLPWLDLLSILPFYIEVLMMLVTTPVVLEEGGLDEFYIYQKGLHFLMVV